LAHIAIVDDEVLIAEQLERQVVKFGHTSCGIATSYDEAIALMEKQAPDMVLLDIRLHVCLPRKILQLKSRLNCLTLKLKNNEKVKIYREPDYGRYQGV
jgi:CheY-like chemotaxis protein